MSKPRILIQLDSDRHPSSFDAVVAVDAQVDQLLQYGGVSVLDVQDLVHGAMFTRGPSDLHQTAIFIGGRDVGVGEQLLESVTGCFFGPMRVSVMLDANGANTTAAAAVRAAARHVDLSAATVLVLAGTGPVGQRAALLAAREGAEVRLGSRNAERAEAVCARIREKASDARLSPVATGEPAALSAAFDGVQVVLAAGAAGVQLAPLTAWQDRESLKVAIDLNAVPPLGIEGIEVTDRAVERHGVSCFGAIGVGGEKMKLHKAAIQRLFQQNDLVLDAVEIYRLAGELETA